MKKRNFAIDLLKIASCCAVVSIHFGGGIWLSDLAVPIFMTCACYLFVFSTDCSALMLRLKRILVPFLTWGLAGFVARSIHERSFDAKVLGSQIIFGAPANSPLYFMSVLMFCCIVIWLVFHWLPKCANWILVAIVVLCFALQYSGLNVQVCRCLPIVPAITVGRIAELLPFAVTGCLLQTALAKRNMSVGLLIGMAILLLGFTLRFAIGEFNLEGYGYGGVVRFCCVAGLCFVLFPLGNEIRLRAVHVNKGVAWLSSMTPGIYFAHKIVGECVRATKLFSGGGGAYDCRFYYDFVVGRSIVSY